LRFKRDADPRDLLALLALLSERNKLENSFLRQQSEEMMTQLDSGEETPWLDGPATRASFDTANQVESEEEAPGLDGSSPRASFDILRGDDLESNDNEETPRRDPIFRAFARNRAGPNEKSRPLELRASCVD